MKKIKIASAAILSLMLLTACESGSVKNDSSVFKNEENQIDIYEKSAIRNVLSDMKVEMEKFEEEDETYYLEVEYEALGEIYYAEIYDRIKLYLEVLEKNKTSENLKMMKKLETLNENIMEAHKNYELLVSNKENTLIDTIKKMKKSLEDILGGEESIYGEEISKYIQGDSEVKDTIYVLEYMNLTGTDNMKIVRDYLKQLAYSGNALSSDVEVDFSKFEEAMDKLIFDNDKGDNYYNKIVIESLKLIDLDEVKKIAEGRKIEDGETKKELQLVYEILGMDLSDVVDSEIATKKINIDLLQDILKQSIYEDNLYFLELDYINSTVD